MEFNEDFKIPMQKKIFSIDMKQDIVGKVLDVIYVKRHLVLKKILSHIFKKHMVPVSKEKVHLTLKVL